MAIDAQLSAGLIDEEQARERREKLEEENSFYEAMDGASKFVRGGAIAGLLSLINNPHERRLNDQIKALRRQLAIEMGFVLPVVRIQDNLQFSPNQHIIRVEEIEADSGEVTTELIFGLSTVWIGDRRREEALFRSYTVVDAATVVTTHLIELIRNNMAELLNYLEAQRLIDDLDKSQQKLVANLIPNHISLGGVPRVLQNLLTERFSFRDLPTILEGISEATAFTRNLTLITDHVRTLSARQLSNVAANIDGIIPPVTLSLDWEQSFAQSIVGPLEERQLAIAPSTLQQFIAAVRKIFEKQAMQGETPVLMVSPGIRPFVRFFIERFRPTTVVTSQYEILPKSKFLTLDQL